MTNKALLEIGTEEIPAKLIAKIHNNLLQTTEQVLAENRINFGGIEVLGAPRRLTVIINNLSDYQEDLVEEIKGPPKKIAFDEDGEPTRAATGFASGQGVNVENLEVRETEKGDYLYAVIEREGKPVSELLTSIFTEIVTRLDFPITMRWGDSDFEFIRPIHWLLGLFNNQIINFEIENIKSGKSSRGHRFLAGRKIIINDVNSYQEKLRQNYVIVDPRERENIIRHGIEKIETEIEGRVIIDEDLMLEIVHLVEYPTPFCGEFNAEYLKMPEPVLVTPIKEHQRYFIIRNESGELLPMFVGVRDGSDKHLDIVKEGNEKVLKARLDDAKFYHEKDQQVTMDERVEQLKNLVFIEELGSMYQKMKRMKRLASRLGKELDLEKEEITAIERTARLAKADLVSQMVREFSELQGIIGEEYAKRENEEEEIAHAISEHYHPRFAGDSLPESIPGIMVSIADRLDTLVGSFGVGLIPSGSEDPFGLRRAALGLIRILWKKDIDHSLGFLLKATVSVFKKAEIKFQRPEDKIIAEVREFLLERVSYLLSEQGVEYDIIETLLNGKDDRIPQLFARAADYKKIRPEKEFEELVVAFTRIKNIVGESEQGSVNTDLFKDKSEKDLYNCYLEVKQHIANTKIEESFIDIYRNLTKLISPVHNFFESVMVMTDKEEVKQNRISLLRQIMDIMLEMGDLSQIVIE